MQSEYIEQRDGGYYLKDVRISLDSIVYAFNAGSSPKTIMRQFEMIDRLSLVYGAIAFYLDNKPAIDKYLEDTEREFEASGIPMSEANPALWQRIQNARAKLAESRA